jgi:hypothetical protein
MDWVALKQFLFGLAAITVCYVLLAQDRYGAARRIALMIVLGLIGFWLSFLR